MTISGTVCIDTEPFHKLVSKDPEDVKNGKSGVEKTHGGEELPAKSLITDCDADDNAIVQECEHTEHRNQVHNYVHNVFDMCVVLDNNFIGHGIDRQGFNAGCSVNDEESHSS